MTPSELLKEYKDGVGFKINDVLKPKEGAERWRISDVVDDKVVVIDQCSIIPHEYTVIGERAKYNSPADRFVKFTINGHDWEKVGRA